MSRCEQGHSFIWSGQENIDGMPCECGETRSQWVNCPTCGHQILRAVPAQGLGATGNYPDGKVSEDDEGELAFSVQRRVNHVFVQFGKYISWLSMSPEEAVSFGETLIKHGSSGGEG